MEHDSSDPNAGAPADTIGEESTLLPSSWRPDLGGAPSQRSQRRAVEIALFGSSEPVTVGRYRLIRLLGRGGMGEVFSARDPETDERVALKLMSRVSPTLLLRFKREFRTLARIEHRNVARFGELVVREDGPPYFTMELIDGRPFVEWVRDGRAPGSAPDFPRLREALRQLLVGVVHLHEAGFVHRDLKPGNVLVTEAGRVVVLDFGLIVERAHGEARLTHEGQVLGTPAYMAPEQGLKSSTDMAVDDYAIGVMLFESLTGRLPVTGSGLDMILAKQREDAPDPSREVPELPEDLRRWTLGLLNPDPDQRSSSAELLTELGQTVAAPQPSSSQLAVASRTTFVGRGRELAELDGAWSRVEREREAVTVHVHGPSGYGKSALLDAFCERVSGPGPHLVLRGRCLERESVPFKGVDALIDALLLWLRRLEGSALASLQPRNLDALTQVFPVLDALWTGPGPGPRRRSAQDTRRLAMSSLRELLARIADTRRLLIAIDDYQWSDADSTHLLASLVREPDPPALMLALAFRDERAARARVDELLSLEEFDDRRIHEVTLGPLDDASARELALALLCARPEPSMDPEAEAAACVARAKGSPFFIAQLVLSPEISATSNVDALVARRLREVGERARGLLEIVALAGGPIARELVAELGPGPQLDSLVTTLRSAGLLAPARGPDEVLETGHDRIREVTAQALSVEAARTLHLALAEVLERHARDPETIAEHLERGGERGRALRFVEEAAARASRSLAFARSAGLLRRALGLIDERRADAGEHRRRLHASLAEQLVNLGCRAEAGQLLRGLADSEIDPRRALVHRCHAAEQLLHAGRVDEGVALASVALDALGEPAPRALGLIVLRFSWERLRLRLRGFDYVARAEDELPEDELERVDALMRLQVGFTIQSLGLAPVMSVRLLLRCLELGERRRVGAMLMFEMTLMSAIGRPERARELRESVYAIAQETDDADLHRLLEFGVGMSCMSETRYHEAYLRFDELVARLREEPTVPWILALSAQLHAHLGVELGHWAALSRSLPTRLAEARERGNPYEIVTLEGSAARLEALRGDVEGAWAHLQRARAILVPRLYTAVNLFLEIGETDVMLIAGQPRRALEHVEGLPKRAREGGMPLFAVHHRSLRIFRGRCLVQLVLRAPAELALQRSLRRLIRRQLRSRFDDERGHGLINQAALHSLRADTDASVACWREAAALLGDMGFEAHHAGLCRRLAAAGEPGPSARADAWFAAQELDDPERVVALLVPAYSR